MKKITYAVLLILGSLFVMAGTARAQCGGKAEPFSIEFKRGSHSATVKGKLRGDEQAEYTFVAGAGQAISINIASVPVNAITVDLQDRNGGSVELQSTGSKWTGELPSSGDYFMSVKIGSGCTSRATYSLTLSIK